ncbi:MAG: gamma carbonic anhydrase family protein [Candidatus Thermoplasmatota archaeon]|nr:gamma carbonic anhydrase family protein [Candidatus Thermoplasmatota archaeon]
MVLRSFGDKRPSTSKDVYVDEAAVVIGDVTLHERASVWPGAVIRADDDSVVVGRGSAVLDLAMIEAPRGRPVTVGDGCIVSHGARLHGCSVGNDSTIGIAAVILDGATIGEKSVVAAGSLVPPGAKIPSGSFVLGVPGRITRQTSQNDLARLREELRALADKATKYRSTP